MSSKDQSVLTTMILKQNVPTQGNKDVCAHTHKEVSVLYYSSVYTCKNNFVRRAQKSISLAADASNFTKVAPHHRQNCSNTVPTFLLHSISYYTQTNTKRGGGGSSLWHQMSDKPLLVSVLQQQSLSSPL